MMLPILISVSVAPVSYFFCVSAPLLDAASTANAAETIATLVAVTGITVSLFPVMACVMAFLIEGSFGDVSVRLPFCRDPHNKKPLRQRRRGCFFSSQLTSVVG